jgi:hypothetical protein
MPYGRFRLVFTKQKDNTFISQKPKVLRLDCVQVFSTCPQTPYIPIAKAKGFTACAGKKGYEF